MLTLHNVSLEDAGEYTCHVSNYIGRVNQSGWLTVLPGKTEQPWRTSSLVDFPFWCFGLFFWSPRGAWLSWDLFLEHLFCVLFGQGIITVLQEAMETRFSSSFYYCFHFSSITSYFSYPTVFLLFLLFLSTSSLFSMVLLVGCMFSKGLVSHRLLLDHLLPLLHLPHPLSGQKGHLFCGASFEYIPL